ncbi:MAG: PDZ domain-containing protein, partial [Clostridia bacterium]|nr:PDZ domain-containing protein [Clostridia bacterium]
MEKILKTANRAAKISAAIILAFSILIGSYNIIIPDSVSCMTGETPNSYGAATAVFTDTVAAFQGESGKSTTTAEYRLFGIIPVKTVTVSVYEKPYYYVGGMPFGVKFSVDGLFVSGYGDEVEKSQNPGYIAGIRPADVITKVDGKDIFGTIFFAEAIDAKKGAPVTLTYERDGKEYTAEVTPYLSSDGRYKTGLLIRDSGAGIGTVTYIDPESKSFGGLGHGICDGETGALIPVLRGFVSEVTINGAVVGTPGSPGELKGSFDDDKNGALT